ncbi:hypothetical protein ONZ51_g5892 [Trametes cubensis]|uniref:Uncharacterized protein n=1 Tax=Trametes cubensis TaxID=1111947 RepID=A0AAD7XD69_9APHY|nr:hypothetical protein ONZ51_g5892 [Trametes cubensis]
MSSSNINDTGAIQALLEQLRSSEAWQRAVASTNAVGGTTQNDAGASTAPAPAPVPETYSGSANALTRTYPTAPSTQPHGSSAGLEASASYPTTAGGIAGGSTAPPGAHSVPPNAQSVASLLSQLQASSTFAAVAGPSPSGAASLSTPAFRRPAYATPPAGSPEFPGPDAALPSNTPPGKAACMGTGKPTIATATTTGALAPRDPTQRQDLRACTFQQALPHLARLSEDEGFLKALAANGARRQIIVHFAHTVHWGWVDVSTHARGGFRLTDESRTGGLGAAALEGTAGNPAETRREGQDGTHPTLTDSFRAELAKFDRERILPAWDGLLTKQQAALESLGVPAMFPTTQQADREVRASLMHGQRIVLMADANAPVYQRQQEVMQVLGRIVKNEGSHTTHSAGRDG